MPHQHAHRTPRADRAHALRHGCDVLTEGILYFMVVFSPWAFGTTQPWSIWTMNVCGYTLGGLMLVRHLAARAAGNHMAAASPSPLQRNLMRGLVACTVLVLAYCLVSALNGRARYVPAERAFQYFENYIPWLPHSYAKERTLAYFWNYLALGLSFWAAYRWLVTDPVRHGHPDSERHSHARIGAPSPRLRRLLWVLSINGALLAFQGMLQRMDGGAKLLWIQETRTNREAASQFGPYAYRSNAAQYFNLLWPAMLGFWWWLELRWREVGSYKTTHRMILPLMALVAVCPIVSLSRAGFGVMLGCSLLVVGVLLASWPGSKRRLVLALLLGTIAVGGAAFYFNGSKLADRFKKSSGDLFYGRGESYVTAWKITKEYPVFGTGPGTFEPVFQLYRTSLDEYWPSQLHNDWLETAITFGAVGTTFILLALVAVLIRWLKAWRGPVPWSFGAMLWVGLVGCLAFAIVDFPFQIYSILFLFLLLCAMVLAVSSRNDSQT